MKKLLLIIILIFPLLFVRGGIAGSMSNASLENEDCVDISDWADNDTGEAVSEQVTFDNKSTFKFDSKTSADTNDEAGRLKDIGSIDGLGNRIVLSVKLYFDNIGTKNDVDCVFMSMARSDVELKVKFASDGIFIRYGTFYSEVGTNLVVQDVWQEWTFDVDVSGGAANAVCDVYLDNVLQASSVDCSYTGTFTDGECMLKQCGYVTDNCISYVDWFKVGDGFGWLGKINGVTNPAKIMGVATANINKVMGVE